MRWRIVHGLRMDALRLLSVSSKLNLRQMRVSMLLQAALEEMGATMSTQACTSDEQLESSLLFGLAFKHHAKASEVKQFCETACIQKLLTIIRKTVALYCNLGDSNSYLTKMTRVCSSPTIPPTSVPTAVPTFQPTNAPREPIPPLVPPPATAAPVIPVSRATVQLDESMQVRDYDPALKLRHVDCAGVLKCGIPNQDGQDSGRGGACTKLTL